MCNDYDQTTDAGAAAMSGSGKPDTITWNDLTVLQQIAIMRIHNGERPLMQIFDQLCHMGLCGVRNGDEYYLSNHALDLYRNYLSSPTAAREAEVTRLTAENGRLREAIEAVKGSLSSISSATLDAECKGADKDEILGYVDSAFGVFEALPTKEADDAE